MAQSRELTVCFTGHRPKGIFDTRPYDEARWKDYQKIVDQLADFVQAMAKNWLHKVYFRRRTRI